MKVERVLVVGGGIAGLAVAAGLARAGVACVVAERVEEWRPVGAGIVLNANALAALRFLGLGDAVLERGERLSGGVLTASDGNILARTDFAAIESAFGPTIGIHRADLHRTLLDGADAADVRLGMSVGRLSQDSDGIDVVFSDGLESRFDLVIGADGIHSKVRELTFGKDPLVYSGYTCWRFVSGFDCGLSAMSEMWGRGKRWGTVPIGDSRTYSFAVLNAPQGVFGGGPDGVERFKKSFAEFGGPVPDLIKTLGDGQELIHTDLCEVSRVRWADGKVLLVGDSAHAMTPNLGQGAGMALEDAAVLVELVRCGMPVADVTRHYRRRREDRVAWVRTQSRRVGKAGQLENPVACWLRNVVVRATPDRVGARSLGKLVGEQF